MEGYPTPQQALTARLPALDYNRFCMKTTFFPPRRNGFILHFILLLTFLVGSFWLFNQASRTPIGPLFAVYMLVIFLLAAAVPFLTYRLYSLLRSSYAFRPGILRLTWGLREEEIPLVNINWISMADNLEYRVPFPLLRWPGSILGIRRLDRRSDIEFMASQRDGLVVIETSRHLYAISPEDPEAFLQAFQRASEIGYFDPIRGQSVHPTAIVETAWQNRRARSLLAVSFLFGLAFAAWIVLYVQPQASVTYTLGNTDRIVNGTQVLLLPVLNGFYFFFNLLVGLFFFRREETQTLSYLLWISHIALTFFFFLSVYLLVF